MKKIPGTYCLFCMLLAGSYKVKACINEYRTLLNGKVTYMDAGSASPRPRFNRNDKLTLSYLLDKAQDRYEESKTIEDYSDYGAMLVYNGRYNEGKSIFHEIESRSPGLYSTAANIGTIYELTGMNDSAYYWIRKALQINPGSHNGSEWIHLKILESKIKAKGDNNYFLTHSVLGIDFGPSEIPLNKGDLDLGKLRSQLYHQLSERMCFVSPKDAIIGQLLFDLGTVNSMTDNVKSGYQVYTLARTYGYSSPVMDKREAYFRSMQQKAEIRTSLKNFIDGHFGIFLLILASGLGTFSFICYRLSRFINKRKQPSGGRINPYQP